MIIREHESDTEIDRSIYDFGLRLTTFFTCYNDRCWIHCPSYDSFLLKGTYMILTYLGRNYRHLQLIRIIKFIQNINGSNELLENWAAWILLCGCQVKKLVSNACNVSKFVM